MALWLMRSTWDRAVWVQSLAGDIVLCSWARHFILTVPHSTQVYKWVPANFMLVGGRGGEILQWTSIPLGLDTNIANKFLSRNSHKIPKFLKKSSKFLRNIFFFLMLI